MWKSMKKYILKGNVPESGFNNNKEGGGSKIFAMERSGSARVDDDQSASSNYHST